MQSTYVFDRAVHFKLSQQIFFLKIVAETGDKESVERITLDVFILLDIPYTKQEDIARQYLQSGIHMELFSYIRSMPFPGSLEQPSSWLRPSLGE